MTVTTDSPFIAPPRISKATFERVLIEAGSPWAHRAGEIYDVIVAARQDPAVWLAICAKEHTYGTNRASVLWRNNTRSWTNARTVRLPSLTGWEIIRDPVRGSNYVRYADVLDSVKDGLYRITDPTHRYVREGRTTIGQVFAIWTEGDGPQYAAFVADRVNAYVLRDRPAAPLAPPVGWEPPQVIRRILPWKSSNTPGVKMDGGTWDWITVHNTGNPNPTANAMHHAVWLEGLARDGAGEPSWQYTVDENVIIQHLEDDWAGFHASDDDGDGNFDSLGFELVEIGDQQRVLWNAGWLIAEKLRSRGKGIDWIRQHHDWARDKKNCPRLLRANGGAGWLQLLAIVGHFLERGTEVPVDTLTFPETGQSVGGGFRAFWEARGGVPIFGFPITPEHKEDGVTVQYFERARFEHRPDIGRPEDWHVVLGLLGREVLDEDAA